MADPVTSRRQTLRLGATGPIVKEWQELIAGVDATVPRSGEYDEATEAATAQFQRALDVEPTGEVNRATRAAMRDLLDWLGALGEQRQELKLGDRGDDVRQAQRLLNRKGMVVEVTGRFGPRMDRTVRRFQRRHGLRADGVIDPATWHELGGG